MGRDPLNIEVGNLTQLFEMIWTNVIPLVLIGLTLVTLLFLVTFLICASVNVFLKLFVKSSQTTDLETKLIKVQVGMAKMNQEIQFIESVLETMIPTVSRPWRFSPSYERPKDSRETLRPWRSN